MTGLRRTASPDRGRRSRPVVRNSRPPWSSGRKQTHLTQSGGSRQPRGRCTRSGPLRESSPQSEKQRADHQRRLSPQRLLNRHTHTIRQWAKCILQNSTAHRRALQSRGFCPPSAPLRSPVHCQSTGGARERLGVGGQVTRDARPVTAPRGPQRERQSRRPLPARGRAAPQGRPLTVCLLLALRPSATRSARRPRGG